MGTITERLRKDGTPRYTAQIRLKRDGKIVHTEAQTFHKRKLAEVWLVKRESELEDTGLPTAKPVVLLKDLIADTDFVPESGGSRNHTLRLMASYELGNINVCDFTTQHVLSFIRRRQVEVKPSTIQWDLAILRSLLLSARTERGLAINLEPLDDAVRYAKQKGWISGGRKRDRRLTSEEETQLMAYFAEAPSLIPMGDIMQFALYSCRRQAEITRLRWSDYEPDKKVILVRDLKHPHLKQGNHRKARLTLEAMIVIDRQPKTADLIFPYASTTIGAAFYRATHLLGIPDLHFHDLRHEAVSRLFERGYAIHEVALFSLHQNWHTLQRYTHLKAEDVPDK